VKAEQEKNTFEGSLLALERIVRDLEQGALPLEDSLEQYSKATHHLKFCYERLKQAEQKVQLLRGVEPDGTAKTVPLDSSSDSLVDKQAARGKRRSARTDIDE
jgi:exodeoxyribonuclease VII small subunit